MLIIIAVLLFGFIIFAHELGHFAAAKWSGVKVNEFAIGMGPTVFKFQKGETKYSLRLLPIGGFCAMEGEDDDSKEDGSFSSKPVWKRIIIVVAGVFMNMLTGFFLMMIILVQQPQFGSTIVAGFSENAVSNVSGLKVGDKIKYVNGYKIITQKDLMFALSTDKDFSVDMVVERDGSKVNLDNVKFNSKKIDDNQEVIVLDFKVLGVKKNFLNLISNSFNDCVSTVRMVWSGLAGLISGQFKFGDMAGPVGAVSAISQAASAGLEVNFVQAVNNILMMMMMLAVNLGVCNLLPLPALDGGRLVFLIVEAVRGKPINPKYEGYVHAAGIVLFILLMVVITYSDILRLFTGKGLG